MVPMHTVIYCNDHTYLHIRLASRSYEKACRAVLLSPEAWWMFLGPYDHRLRIVLRLKLNFLYFNFFSQRTVSMNCRYEKFEYSTTLLKFWLYIETSAKVMIVWKFDHLPNYLSYGPCSPNSESSHLLAPIVALYLQFCWSNVDKTRWPATFCSSVVRNCQRLIRCWWNISDQYCCWINKSKITRPFFWYEIKMQAF